MAANDRSRVRLLGVGLPQNMRRFWLSRVRSAWGRQRLAFAAGVADLLSASAFYDLVARSVGWSRLYAGQHIVVWGPPAGGTGLAAIDLPEDDTFSSGRLVGAILGSRQQVQHAIAATCGGAQSCYG